ncbi:hypothetical protein [Nocardiopsis sp. NRRL B-16309]|uniref:hypothetical protein n=1 Tax=Nocardiopsis sp. NRRL B-16309 TaxID=1519494 RepID=UPI0006AFBFCD|nr:hypothetical protein [Nocardiopsis sp. NRRL B-16309]KOX18036.1 hypothetical protein ADL05_07915 [Nocardiopsis sp. NRRL B-16309]
MSNDTPIQYGEVTATYFWDDGSGINGDTGAPASGEPMQEGLFSSPSWPLGTEGYIVYEGEEYDFFIGDRGPGEPSHDCDVLLDIDGKTFAKMMGTDFDETSLTVGGGNGHAEVEYYITEWGDGAGTEGAPHPFMQEGNSCENAVSPIPEEAEAAEEEASEDTSEDEESQAEESEESADDGSDEQDAQEEEVSEESAAPADESDDGGVSAETAANDLSGAELTGADSGMLSGTGLLTLALVPAILVAVLFVWSRRAAGAHAGAADGRGKGLMAASDGRHSLGSLLDRLRGRK